MQPQLPPGIERLTQVPPQSLKTEHQQSQPARDATHVGVGQQQQQWPQLQMPLAQWQVVRMLYQGQAVTATRPEQPYAGPLQSSPTLQLAGEGELTVRWVINGKPQQITWQIQAGEAVLIASTLARPMEMQLLPTLNGGWRLVPQRFEVNEPLQLLWRTDGAAPPRLSRAPLHLKPWLIGGLIVIAVLLIWV